MYAYIKGVVEEIEDGCAVVETGGIGYRLYVPQSDLDELSLHDEVKLHTHYVQKEDGASLYGFVSREELRFFRLLITVSGIGPKGALSILSTLSVDDLKRAIIADEPAFISRAPGVGKKSAQKVILELKDKLTDADLLSGASFAGETKKTPAEDTVIKEAVDALTNLGYGRAEAAKAVGAVALEGEAVEDILKKALKALY